MAQNRWRIREAVRIAEEELLRALRTGAEAILTEAIDETPVDTGTLRRSGTVTVGKLPDGEMVHEAAEAGNEMKDAFPVPIGREKAVYISFSTPYAIRQHEEIDYNHPRGGKAKYLEDPFNRKKRQVVRYAELRVRRALRNAR